MSLPCELSAKPNVIQLRWEELSPYVVGRDVELQLPDGTKLRGETVSVRDDILSLDVKKTSNKRAYPKGQLASVLNLFPNFAQRALGRSPKGRTATPPWIRVRRLGGYVECGASGSLINRDDVGIRRVRGNA